MHLQGLFSYPVKSFAGQTLKKAKIQPEGIIDDRRWLITEVNGRFLTARRIPRMLLWQVKSTSQGLTLIAPNGEQVNISPQECRQIRDVSVWQDCFPAFLAPHEVNQWLTAQLGLPCLLFYLGEKSPRPLSGHLTGLSFADSAPYLLTSTASLQASNQTLPQSVEINRFRPNFVITGERLTAWEEESWQGEIKIGEVKFEFLKCCTRCPMVNINPSSGEKGTTGQPLSTLKVLQKSRLSGSAPVFGVYLVAKNCGVVQVGDTISIL